MEIGFKALETINGISQQHQNCGDSSFTCHLQKDPTKKKNHIFTEAPLTTNVG